MIALIATYDVDQFSLWLLDQYASNINYTMHMNGKCPQIRNYRQNKKAAIALHCNLNVNLIAALLIIWEDCWWGMIFLIWSNVTSEILAYYNYLRDNSTSFSNGTKLIKLLLLKIIRKRWCVFFLLFI